MPSSHGRKPPNPQKVKPQHGRKPLYPGRHDGKSTDDCCPMAAAVRSVKRGKFRLARRYAAMSVRLLVGRLA
jgi:hypothetical protein